jgi:DNA-binding transcriptional ArsR family regulator
VSADTRPDNMATMKAIATELGLAQSTLRRLVDRLYRAGAVELGYQKRPEGTLYDVAAVKVAVLPHLAGLQECERVTRARNEAEQAASHARKAERARAHAARLAARSAHPLGPQMSQTHPTLLPPSRYGSKARSRRPPDPEVYVRRRPGPTP